MAYVSREDGERFIIPSYRDVLVVKKQALLRKEILLLSSDYGGYITLQRKNVDQYEVAFSTEAGYLLGETVWSYFKRPQDLLYCEAIPNTSEAILVIVKSGIVYLDGVFPIDAIIDELLIFHTQKNNFEIYIYGDVPISKTPEDGKFVFDSSSVKSFNVLDKPVFPTLPTVKAFQLQPVNVVLKSKGIGGLPTKTIILAIAALGFVWVAWSFLTAEKKEGPVIYIRAPSAYQTYISILSSPDPAQQVRWVSTNLWLLSTIPGWSPLAVDFVKGALKASVKSDGARTNLLYVWADANHATVSIEKEGFYLTIFSGLNNRPGPSTISNLDRVVAAIIDSLSYVSPNATIQVGLPVNKGVYSEREIKLAFTDVTPATLDLIGQQLKNLPLVLNNISITMDNGFVSGTISLKALGS